MTDPRPPSEQLINELHSTDDIQELCAQLEGRGLAHVVDEYFGVEL